MRQFSPVSSGSSHYVVDEGVAISSETALSMRVVEARRLVEISAVAAHVGDDW